MAATVHDITPADACVQGHFTAEGPIWDAKRKVFFYTDIEGGTLHRFDPASGQTTTWQLGEKGTGDKNGQMIGGTTALNADGSLVIMLENGPRAGVNYFNPDNGELLHLPGTLPQEPIDNRPNDSTVVKLGDETLMVYGTMSKKHSHPSHQDERGMPKREGAFYVLGKDMQSHKLKFSGPAYIGTMISNGLADGGTNPDGTVNLYWAETVGPMTYRNVYRGKLDPKTYEVKDVHSFVSHLALTSSDTDAHVGRPDGANMVYYKGKPAYAIAALEMGEIRLFDPADPAENPRAIATLKLPKDIPNITKFAIGEDKDGNPAIFVTTINFTYPKEKGGKNGSTFLMKLPKEITLHPASAQVTTYPSMEEMKQRDSAQMEGGTPGHVVSLAAAVAHIEPTIERSVGA